MLPLEHSAILSFYTGFTVLQLAVHVYVQKSPLNAHSDVSDGNIGIIFVLSLLLPYLIICKKQILVSCMYAQAQLSLCCLQKR